MESPDQTFSPSQTNLFTSITSSLSSLIHSTGLLSLSQTSTIDIQTLNLVTKFTKKVAKKCEDENVKRGAVIMQLAVALSLGDVGGVVR